MSADLGMIDSKAEEVEIFIAGRDFRIRQSPGLLQSNRERGTTGAAIWQASIRFAEWIGSPENPLFKHGVLDSESVVLELGSGISGHVASVLSSRVRKVVATDQQYALKLLRENIEANHPPTKSKSSGRQKSFSNYNNIDIIALDWETDDISSFLRGHELDTGVDAVLVCDCIFNYALVDPLVQTCVDINKPRSTLRSEGESKVRPTIYVVAQQLRQPEVFEEWLAAFSKRFHVWRMPSGPLGDGFVVHIALPRAV